MDTPMKRRIFLDMHFPDWPDRQTATAFDPDEIAQTMIDSHVGSVILYAKCQYGNFYYDTKLGHKHSGLGQLDLFRSVSEKLKAHGIEVIAYYSVVWDEWQAKAHPEWLVEGPHGERDNLEEYRWSTLCMNSPYRDVVFAHLDEISRVLAPDGFWIDMTIIGNNRCFCPHCRALFREQTGMELTADALSDEAMKNRFAAFRYDYVEAFYRQAYQTIRNVLPHANLANNYWGYPYSPWVNGSRAVGALQEANFVTGEAYTDWTGLSAPGFFSTFLRGVGQGRPFEALIGRFVGTWDYTAKPATQLALEAYTVAAHGGIVTVDDEPFADGHLDHDVYADIQTAFAEIQKREHLLEAKPVRFAAILHSQITKDVHFHGSEAFAASFAGAYRMLKETQCPAEIVLDEALTPGSLDGFSLLLLPCVAVIPPEQWAIIAQFARDGGLVIAAGPTGMYRLEGDRKAADQRVPDALGLTLNGMSEYTISYIGAQDAALQAALPKRPLTVRGPYVKSAVTGAARVLAHVVDPICEMHGKVFFHNNLPAPYEATAYPAITSTQMGKGSFVWFAQDVFAQFGRYHQRELKSIFAALMRQAGIASPMACSCASNVELVLCRQGEGRILHLINFTPGMTMCLGTMDVFEGRYPRTFEFVDRVNALGDIDIAIDGAYTSAKVFTTGQALATRVSGGKTMLTLPRLDMWESIELH